MFRLQNRAMLRALLAAVIILLAGSLPLIFIWHEAKELVDFELENSLKEIAASATLHVDGDLHKTFTSVEQEGSPAFIQQIAKLRKFQSIHPRIKYIYTFILRDDKPYFILDAAPPGDLDNDGVEDHASIMEEYRDPTPNLMKSLRSQRGFVENEFYTDQWGTFLSAYHPVYDSLGEFVSLLGVDLTIEEVASIQSSIRREGLFALSLVIFCALGVATAVFILEKNLQKMSVDKQIINEERVKIQKLESVGFLAGGIAHDFNNILTSILGNLTLYQDERETSLSGDDKAEILREAVKASERAKQLTNQLLIFAKGGAPVKTVIDVGHAIQEAGQFILRGSACTLDQTIPENLWYAEADSGQIQQVIQNLIINAQQAMVSGGSIRMTARNITLAPGNTGSLAPGPYISVAVSDTGSGIDPDIQEKIFDPYFSTKEGGSGLGLSTSFFIMKKHDGTIRFTTVPGQGATFTLLLPATPVHLEEPASQPRAAQGPDRSVHVLIMDDEEAILKLAKRILNSAGHQTGVATHGEEALQYVEAAQAQGTPVDVAILDLTIPGGMGGKDAARELRRRFPECKLIVSSGYSVDEILGNYQDHGFTGLLKKPYVREELLESIQAVIEHIAV